MSDPIKVQQVRKAFSEFEGVCIVEKYSNRTKIAEEFESSPSFFTGQNNEFEWCIDVFMRGYDHEHLKYLGVRFFLLEGFDSNFSNELKRLRFIASVLDENDKKYSAKSAFYSEIDMGVIIKDFVLTEDLLKKPELLPNGELRFAFQISPDADIDMSQYQKSQLNILGKVLDDGKYADFKLVIKGKEFNVHRAILAARSPVFEAMFRSQMRENSEGKADIVDVEANVMEKLLRFVYVGRVENFENLAGKVLVAAEKYQIDELKQLCEDVLAEQLNPTNVHATLCLADENNAQNLKKRAIDFFQRNINELYADVNFDAHLGLLSEQLKIDIIRILAKSLLGKA